jgi:DNA-binding LytR/AlgR family response regulator
MLLAVIIEDDQALARDLRERLERIEPDIQVDTVIGSVKEGIEYFSRSPRVQLIFSDVQLADGLSFSIFDNIQNDTPVIFITGYDQFVMKAMDHNGIDYLLKPYSDADLAKAIAKFRRLENHFLFSDGVLRNILKELEFRKKSRIIVKKGQASYALPLSGIVLFTTENKIIHALDQEGRKYIVDKKLSDLESELDPSRFFRVNRQFILNMDYIAAYKPYERVKLQVELSVHKSEYFIVVSQEMAPLFKKWLAAA